MLKKFAETIYPLAESYVKRDISSKRIALEHRQLLTPPIRAHFLRQNLFKTVRDAKEHVPYYRDALAQFNPEKILMDIQFLNEIPLLTKEIIVEQGERMLSDRVSGQFLHERKTGGSTGISMSVFYTQEDLDWTAAVSLSLNDFTGRSMRDKEVHLSAEFGDPVSAINRVYGTVKNLAMNRSNIFVSSVDDAHLNDLYQGLRREQPFIVQAHPSTIYALASYLESRKIKAWPLFQVFESTGEALFPHQIKKIETVLGCKVYNRYGSAEFGVVAHSRANPNLLEVIESVAYPETVKIGEKNELVLTGLLNHAMPLIRYCSGDSAEVIQKDGIYFLDRLEGRVHDLVRVGDKLMPTHFIQDVLDRFHAHQEFQVIYSPETRQISKILIVPNEGLILRSDVEAGLEQFLHQKIKVEWVPMDGLQKVGHRLKFRRALPESVNMEAASECNPLVVCDVYLPATEPHVVEIPYLLYILYRVWGEFDPVFDLLMDLNDPVKRPMFLYWWLAYGRNHHNIERLLLSDLNRNYLLTKIGESVGPLHWTHLSNFAFIFESNGAKQAISLPLPEHSGERIGEMMIKWYFVAEVPYRNLFKTLTEEQKAYLFGTHESFIGLAVPIDRLMYFLYELAIYFDPSISKRFDLSQESDRKDYRDWYHQEGKKLQNIYKYYEEQPVYMAPLAEVKGVNIVGHVNSVSGVGEDIRMASAALTAAKIPSHPLSFSKPTDIDQAKFQVNLHCLTGFQILLESPIMGNAFFTDRFNIGYFPWELSEWPKELIPALDLCQELWTSTQFIHDSIKPFTKKEVRVMPMTVELPESIWGYLEAQNKLPRRKISFLFMFDFLSGIERKNAWACLDAFQSAFQGNEEVELIVKTINFNPALEFCVRLEKLIALDSRIKMIDEMMTRDAVLELVCRSDAFLSLHRAEGFGRGIAESLLLGKHVVVTNYSGNVDFCKPEHSFLVDYDLVPVKAHEYVFSQNQFWAQVRLADAAVKLHACYETIRRGNRFNLSGQKYIQDHYSREVVGKIYRARLQELNLI